MQCNRYNNDGRDEIKFDATKRFHKTNPVVRLTLNRTVPEFQFIFSIVFWWLP